MKMWRWMTVAATAQIVVLAGCVPAVMAPTVVATPGPGKLPADFASDHAACTVQVSQKIAPAIAAANNQVAGTALLNVMTGTGDNAVAVNAQATATLQQQYDAAYSACMYAKGNNVPGYYMQPTYYAEPTPAPRPKKRVAHKPSPPKAEFGASLESGLCRTRSDSRAERRLRLRRTRANGGSDRLGLRLCSAGGVIARSICDTAGEPLMPAKVASAAGSGSANKK